MTQDGPDVSERSTGAEITSRLVTLDDIRAAHDRIRPFVMHTPLCAMSQAKILLKAESLQPSGAFKLRAAFNNLLRISHEVNPGGVVAHSSGNHAIAVAYAGSVLGIPVAIVMPEDAPKVKVDWTARLGAEVVIVGRPSSERADRAAAMSAERDWPLVEPYDSLGVVEATATVAVEIFEDLREREGEDLEIFVPCSGGGLVSGVAAAAKLLETGWRVVAVEAEVAANALASRAAGERVTFPADQMSLTIADGLRVQRLGEVNWQHIETYVDEIVTVSEDEIRAAMKSVAREARLVAEPSGAVSVAAAMAGRGSARREAEKRVAVVSGGNVDLGHV